MTEPSPRSLQLLDALEAQLDRLATLETELQQWQALAERRGKRLDRCEDRMYQAHAHWSAEREGLKQERDVALGSLARLTELLLSLLKALEHGATPDLESLQTVTDAAVSLLSQHPNLAQLLDNLNLDNTLSADPK